ncbi:MAG: hypothetical protein WCK08_09750 [Betaproteobacteria bacterium]
MNKKPSTSLERLQRIVDADRPTDKERDGGADQLITQDQLRRLDTRMKKLAYLPPSRPKKAPPAAAPGTVGPSTQHGQRANKAGARRSA